ncbi:MAG: hypothetical protein IT356_05245 [Gemmatimonadaceae bacterium]|nr:hypothetical protein [Gemmatimonadaceae bacterium]
MIRKIIPMVAIAALAGLTACENQLVVTNPNAGETKRVLGTPNDAEAMIGTYWKRWMSGVYGSTTNLEGMANIISFMNSSSLANNCQNARTPFTGASNVNAPGNVCSGEQQRLYFYDNEVNRVAASFLGQMANGLTLGTPARDGRVKAWSYYLSGLAVGYTALMYDSTSVVSVGQAAEDAGKMIGYKDAADSAYAFLQKAIDAAAATPAGSDGFPIPAAWLPSPTSYTSAEFVRLVRSYRARLRAYMARTPAERAAADWGAIMADVDGGITSDQVITTSTTAGPSISWRQQYEAYQNWHQMPPFFIGMADVSGSYAAWIGTPVGNRGAGNSGFFMVTPDLRFPQGNTRADQQADFTIKSCEAASTPCKRYFVNRPQGGDDFSGPGFGTSNYDFVRYHSWNTKGDGTARNGNTVIMYKAEMDLLKAEGLYRKGDYAGAAALVNITRVKNGLPAIAAFDATSKVPGGANCVPKVPVAPYNVVDCGTLWDALKYEKRIETAYSSYSPWFFEGRGWGDMGEGQPTFWAVPFQELQSRGYSIAQVYGAGPGIGNAPNSVSGKSAYGW